ncbi:ABC transporter substrate-binding protein [Antrihabitans sp. NCIMB 15449]|uniref:ABC transporter substrate-binding protein n=1 Tax=Antrihabitans spumae TaxID=3373370 RepID=A0ABW7JVH0_9NOCA
MGTRAPGSRVLRLLGVILAALLLVLVTACDTHSGEGGTDADGNSDRTVTIGHSKGKTSVNGIPKKIVALGTQWLDAAQVLGVTPIGYIDNVGRAAGATNSPWEPPTLQSSTAIDPAGDVVAQVEALDPDLILVTRFGPDEYDKLSKIAPTIPELRSSEVDSWGEQIDILGKILDKQGQAASVAANINGRIDAIAAKNPGLKGKTFVTTFLSSPTRMDVLADPKDGASVLFTRLGMTLPEKIVAEVGPTGRAALPPERLVDLNTDLLVATSTPEMTELFKALPGYDTLPSVQKDSIVYLDVAAGTGLNQPSPLSIPYVLDRLEAGLANAAK